MESNPAEATKDNTVETAEITQKSLPKNTNEGVNRKQQAVENRLIHIFEKFEKEFGNQRLYKEEDVVKIATDAARRSLVSWLDGEVEYLEEDKDDSEDNDDSENLRKFCRWVGVVSISAFNENYLTAVNEEVETTEENTEETEEETGEGEFNEEP